MSRMTATEINLARERIEGIYKSYKCHVQNEHVTRYGLKSIRELVDLIKADKVKYKQTSSLGYSTFRQVFYLEKVGDLFTDDYDCETIRKILEPVHREKETLLNLFVFMDKKELYEKVSAFCEKYGQYYELPKCNED